MWYLDLPDSDRIFHLLQSHSLADNRFDTPHYRTFESDVPCNVLGKHWRVGVNDRGAKIYVLGNQIFTRIRIRMIHITWPSGYLTRDVPRLSRTEK